MKPDLIEPVGTGFWHWDDSTIGASFLRDPSGHVFGAVFRNGNARLPYTHRAVRFGEVLKCGTLEECKAKLDRRRKVKANGNNG
jgi:hypothetical protein